MERMGFQRVGIYIDVANIAQNGGYGIAYDVLREFACRNHGTAVRLNAYLAYDEERAKNDVEYRRHSLNFHANLRDYGYKVIVKHVRFFFDELGHRYAKANADLDLAVDALLQSSHLDYVLLVTGDGDFLQVIRALQNKGCRVDVLGFKNVSYLIKNEADIFVSGFLVPDLIPVQDEYGVPINNIPWGKEGSYVRGICYTYNKEKNFGFFRVLDSINKGLWITDSRKENSPYKSIFFHSSNLPENVDLILPNRNQIFEFKLAPGDKGFQALDIRVGYKYSFK